MQPGYIGFTDQLPTAEQLGFGTPLSPQQCQRTLNTDYCFLDVADGISGIAEWSVKVRSRV